MALTDYELEQLCERQTDCGCDCMRCPLFAQSMEAEELGD